MGEKFMDYHPDPLIRDYDDRGMMKWLGFYLSEHTAEMDKESAERNKTWQRKKAMTSQEISDVLENAYYTNSAVSIQLNLLNAEGQAFADIFGTIEGHDDENLFIATPDKDMQIIPNDSIHHVELIPFEKWSDLS